MIGIGVASNYVRKDLNKSLIKSIISGNAEHLVKEANKFAKSGKGSIVRVLGLGGAALWIANIVDAYKGDKHKSKSSCDD